MGKKRNARGMKQSRPPCGKRWSNRSKLLARRHLTACNKKNKDVEAGGSGEEQKGTYKREVGSDVKVKGRAMCVKKKRIRTRSTEKEEEDDGERHYENRRGRAKSKLKKEEER